MLGVLVSLRVNRTMVRVRIIIIIIIIIISVPSGFLLVGHKKIIIIIIIITDLYSAFRSEDTEALGAAQED